MQAGEHYPAERDGAQHDTEQRPPRTDDSIEGERERESSEERRDLRQVGRALTKDGRSERGCHAHAVLEPRGESPRPQRDVSRVVDAEKDQYDAAGANAEPERRERGDGAGRQPPGPHEAIADAPEWTTERGAESLNARGH